MRVGLTILLVLLIPVQVRGQSQPTSTGRKFDPPLTTVEITGNEPTTKAYQLEFGGGGGTGPIPSSRVAFRLPSQTPYWVVTPVMESPSFVFQSMDYQNIGELVACNYQSDPAPRAILTDPEGRQEQLPAKQATDIPGETGCWRVSVPLKTGMGLGLYTLTLDHPQGQISHQWGIDYPPCFNASVGIKDVANNTNERVLFSGLAPHQTFNAYFFHTGNFQENSSIAPVYRIADRQITSGDSGEALIDLRTARSAPYDLSSVIYLLVGPDGKLLYINNPFLGKTEGDWKQLAQEVGITTESAINVPQAKYATYAVSLDPNLASCSQKLGQYAQAVGQGGSVALYHDFGDTSNQTGNVAAGDPVLVLEQKAAIMDGHVVVWSHVRAESGADGWSYGNQFHAADIAFVPGSKFEIQQVGTSNGQPLDVTLRKAPQANGDAISTLKPGSLVTLVQDGPTQPDWLYVQDEVGNIGYMPLAINYQTGQPAEVEVASTVDPYVLTAVALPWAPADVSKIPPPPLSPS